MRIGVISDTHGLLRPEALDRLSGVARIVHAGDVGRPDILERLARIAPVHAVRGNVDTADWARTLPETLDLDLEGQVVHVLHDAKALTLDAAAAGPALVISGHSHRAGVRTVGRTMMLNPGSAGPRRFRLPVTLATFEVGPGGLAALEIHRLLP